MQIPATLMRGGTSKCWIFDATAVPVDRDELAAVLIETFGSADPRQLDGVGGGTSVTSKAAVVARSSDPEFDVEYLFAQVAVGSEVVEWGSNCGNCASAVALWAIEHFDLPRGPQRSLVRMRNVNTGAGVSALVATSPDAPEASVPGVRGGGTPVDLAFVDPAGSTTGSLWPTGAHRDELVVDGIALSVTMADAGAPVALVDAESMGVVATATEEQLLQYVPMLRKVRARAAVAMGLAASVEDAFDAVPKVGLVGRPADYTTSLGERAGGRDYDVAVRMLSMNAPHPTIGLTSAVAIALAATEPDTVMGRVGRLESPAAGLPDRRLLELGTLGGLLRCEVQRDEAGTRVLLRRAARRLAESTLYTR